MTRPVLRTGAWWGLSFALVHGCASDPGNSGTDGTGSARAAITIVPGGVQCVRVTLRGAATNFPVMPLASAVLDLGPLVPGSLLVSAQAYAATCKSVMGSTTADWVSDPLTATVTAGLTTDLAITLRPNAAARLSVDFVQPVRSIALGAQESFAVTQSGSLYAWGANFNGQLGDGTMVNRSTPVLVPGLSNVRQVSSGTSSTCAVLENGQLWCWGDNSHGTFGNGTTTSSSSPVLVAPPAGLTFVRVSVSALVTCAVMSDASVWCWGYGGYGQLGNGTNVGSNSPVRVNYGGGAALTDVLDVHVGIFHVCAVSGLTGGAFCWGNNQTGEFGTGYSDGASSVLNTPQPTQFRVLTSIRTLESSTCALGMDGNVRCAGYNAYGDLGDGTTVDHYAPALVAGLSGVTQLATADYHACAVAGGTAWCWGSNTTGQLGDVTETSRSAPVQVVGLTNVVEVETGYYHSCARLSDGSMWCWGNSGAGQLGDGTTNAHFTPVRVRL